MTCSLPNSNCVAVGFEIKKHVYPWTLAVYRKRDREYLKHDLFVRHVSCATYHPHIVVPSTVRLPICDVDETRPDMGVPAAFEGTLSRLGTDYIDLFLVHYPGTCTLGRPAMHHLWVF